MARTLALDLGTNSIGYVIRDVESSQENKNQIIDAEVIIFKKGVGNGENGEFSLAAERRTNKGKRRLYNAKRYRKWATLRTLIENNMCPLSIEELELWSIGDWQKGEKNKGRKYPLSPNFTAWLVMDFDRINNPKEENEKYKRVYNNPYELRLELIENCNENDKHRLYKIGRIMYHLAQRRGFKSSRKNGGSPFGKDEDYEKWKTENTKPSIAKFYVEKLQKEERVRGRKPMQRDYIINDDFKLLCETQKIDKTLIDKIHNAIYFVRPLRTQRGMVGNCTMESVQKQFINGEEIYLKGGKPRIPISHPLFEEFRALQLINNIQWRITGSNESFESIPIPVKKKIFQELFFRTIHNKKTNKYEPISTFKFEDIVDKFSEKRKYEFNYARYKDDSLKELYANPSVSACPVITGLMSVLKDEWQDKFIEEENSIGINWQGLAIEYSTIKNKKTKIVKLDAIGLWHLIFDFIQTQDKEEELIKFVKDKFEWDDVKAIAFTDINIQQGYGSLSKNAIEKILPNLCKGFIYSEAVLFANLGKVLGKEKFENKEKEIKKRIREIISEIDANKEKLNIVNGLIQQYFGELDSRKKKGVDFEIKKQAAKDVAKKLSNYFGESNWQKFSPEKKKTYSDFVSEKYICFLDGKQKKEEKASYKPDNNPDIDYYKLPRLDEAIKIMLKKEFGATDDNLKHIYHPSDIKIYPDAVNAINKETGEILDYKLLDDPQPTSKAWKNPMAMRTMFEIKHLINYLLEEKRIDENTRIVIEMARELNTSNMRKAITDWGADRDKENKEYAKAIAEMYGVNNPSEKDFNLFRSAIEQITEYEFEGSKSLDFLNKYNEFVSTFLIKKNKKKNSDEESENENEESFDSSKFDYLMYLILTREEFVRMLITQPLGVGRILNVAKDFKNKRKSLQEMITKYRLWKQQKFQCFYTGQHISFTDLFDGAKYQIEHTIPRSISFDSELKNLTVCDAVYNNQIKSKKFPTECPNYYKESNVKTVKGLIICSPIKKRVDTFITPKVLELKKRIKSLESACKKIADWEKDKKDANIRLRHYLKFELDYWEKKLFTFTVERKDWKDKFKNSQLIDTQIITKYARAYLKSLFKKVDVQKGIITAQFREIYQLPPKSRGNHTHHAIDAAVLSLIPGSATRDIQLEDYFKYKEGNNSNYQPPLPYEGFTYSHIQEAIDKYVTVNHVKKDNVLKLSKKFARKRGEIEYLKYKKGDKKGQYILDTNGNKMPKVMQGDSIRGQLHLETFYGAIIEKPIIENNRPKKENRTVERKGIKVNKEVYLFEKLKNPEFTIRKAFNDKINILKIIDPCLIEVIQKQQAAGKKIGTDDFFYNGNKIRHVKVLEGKDPIIIKPNIFISSKNAENKKHKHNVYATNTGNYCLCAYKYEDDYKVKIYSKFELGKSLKGNKNSQVDIKELVEKNICIGKKPKEKLYGLYQIIKTGDKVVFYSEDEGIEGIKKIYMENNKLFQQRIYVIDFFESDYSISLKQSILSEFTTAKGTTEFKFDNPPERWRGKYAAKDNGLIYKKVLFEHKDFKVMPDGEIKWTLK